MKYFRIAALSLLAPMCLAAQMTVSGTVTSGAEAVSGASVGVASLGITTRTNAQGRYSFLVRSALVQGQTVTIVARHGRYGSQEVQVRLTGAPIVQDFTLAIVDQPTVTATPTGIEPRLPFASRVIDSSAFVGVAGPLDLGSALAGRFPGLFVTSASHGGSSQLLFRGARSLAGSTQPLVVIDGVAIENTSLTTALQQFGLGGFDYGTPLGDIALDDIATVTLMNGAEAVPLYGGRAANGVLFITTKVGGSLRGLDVAASMRFSGESPIRLPAYQDRYGQGLGGQFEFFDGQGGGINDAADQSWGPALDGQPISQASLAEPRRPDVRYWLPNPSGVREYFQSGRTLDASVVLTGTRQWASGRAALNARDVKGLTPNAGTQRLGLTFTGAAQPTARVTGRAMLQFIDTKAQNRPGTGFDEVNPVSGFTRMGRQVDLAALRDSLDSGTEQLNWIYTTRNNPYFQSSRNTNEDSRTHVIAGGALHVGLGRGFSATLSAGLDDNDEDRNVDVAAGWIGTYPTIAGRRDFSNGGTERQTLGLKETTAGLALSSLTRRWQRFDVSAVAGVEQRSSALDVAGAVTDTGAVSVRDSSTTDVTSVYVAGSVSRDATWFLDAGARLEQSTAFAKDLGTAAFPTVSLTYDAVRGIRAMRPYFGAARVRTSWWSAGNEIGQRGLRRAFAGGGTAVEPTLGIGDSTSIPERTTGLEAGTE
ncbi:MAG: TonB-dependent receptor plug domain-containing protein, partial [Gemmatimonadaceae bacterium]